MNHVITERELIVCPECGYTQFYAKVQDTVTATFYIDNNLIYPKTDVIDTEDDTLKDIECVNCKAILATTLKDLKILLKVVRGTYG